MGKVRVGAPFIPFTNHYSCYMAILLKKILIVAMTAISSNKILNEIVQLRFALMGKGRGFSSSASAKSDLDYGKLIRQKEQEIIELVHAYNKTKKKLGADSAQSNQGKTGYASSSSDKAKSLKITHFRRLLLS